MTPQVKQILIDARALLISPGYWHPSPQGCAVVAINTVSRTVKEREHLTSKEWLNLRRECWEPLGEACKRLFDKPTVRVNDQMGFDAILLAFDVTIGDYPAHAPKEPGTKAGHVVCAFPGG